MSNLPLFVPIFALLGIILIIAAIYTIFRFKQQANNRLTWFVTIALISVGFWILGTYLQLDTFTVDNNIAAYTIVTSVSNIAIILGLILFVSFVQYFVQPKLRTKQLILEIFLLALAIGFYIVHIYAGFHNDKSLVEFTLNLANIINPIITIIVLYSSIKDLQTLLNENLSDQQRSQVVTFRNSLVIGFGGIIPVIVIAAVVNQSLLAYSYVIISAALFFVVRAYSIDPRIAFILPERTYLAIVVNNFGTLRYRKIFQQTKEDELDSSAVLISGALKAVTTMMSEFYNADVQPSLIMFRGRMILFLWTKHYFIAVFTDQDSPLIRSAMAQTVIEIEKKYGDELIPLLETSPRMLELDEIFAKTFFFIYS